jgi:hypothetical protein
MSWLKALDLLFKAKDIKDQASDLKTLYDYADRVSKLDPAKVTWDDLKYFENAEMKAATTEMRAIEKILDDVLGSKLVPPESGSLKAFDAALKAGAKYGHNSKEAKAAIEAYRKVLVAHDKVLKGLLADMEKMKGEFPGRTTAAKALNDYCRLLEKLFLDFAKIPFGAGTVQNATFFSLSRDCTQLAGIASSVETKLKKAASEHNIKIGEMKDLIWQNEEWIAWAAKDALAKEDTLKKNAKAETPKK